MSNVVRFHETGGPEVLRFEEHEVGDPGAGELRVRMEAIGLNRAEVMFREGAYLEDPDLPAGNGYEGGGTVEAVGEGVTDFSVGEAVSIIPAFSLNQYSVYGERAIVPARAVVHRPEQTDAVHGSAVWMPYLTAYGALIDFGGLRRGQAVAITAASSSVGLAAIQIANSIGATPIAVTRGRGKVAALQQAGAAHVIVSGEEDVTSALLEATRGRGADLVFDPVAGSGVEALAQGMARHGTLFLYGLLSGEPTPFPLIPALAGGLSVRGYTLFEITGDDTRFERGKAWITRGLESGDLRPTVDRTFAFNEMVAAHRYLESNQQFGKIVVTV